MAYNIDPILTPTEVAAFAKVSTKTVYRAIRSGALQAYGIGHGSHYRITQASMLSWLGAMPSSPAPRAAVLATPGRPSKGSPSRLRAIERGEA